MLDTMQSLTALEGQLFLSNFFLSLKHSVDHQAMEHNGKGGSLSSQIRNSAFLCQCEDILNALLNPFVLPELNIQITQFSVSIFKLLNDLRHAAAIGSSSGDDDDGEGEEEMVDIGRGEDGVVYDWQLQDNMVQDVWADGGQFLIHTEDEETPDLQFLSRYQLPQRLWVLCTWHRALSGWWGVAWFFLFLKPASHTSRTFPAPSHLTTCKSNNDEIEMIKHLVWYSSPTLTESERMPLVAWMHENALRLSSINVLDQPTPKAQWKRVEAMDYYFRK
tara:strand:+ start:126 stop:953 length:828 start_codon:yes stop_codon:yes gene_type:complete